VRVWVYGCVRVGVCVLALMCSGVCVVGCVGVDGWVCVCGGV
jgi:hypothetical protein